MIALQVAGKSYINFTKAEVILSMDSISGGFTFSAVDVEGAGLPFKGGESCKITVDDVVVIDGFIDIINVEYSANLHSIIIEGRDKTSDIIDSTIENTKMDGANTLKQVIEKVIKDVGADIAVTDSVGLKPFNQAEDKLSARVGQNAFNFIDKLSRKQAVLLASDVGNINIIKPSTEALDITLKNVLGADDNNIKSASYSNDLTQRFNKYKARSQYNLVAADNAGEIDTAQLVNQSGEYIDDEIRATRQFILQSENTSAAEKARLRAEWEGRIRKTRSTSYGVVVVGHQNTLGIWKPNTLVNVVDDFAGISDTMLINTVTFKIDVDSGTTTELSLVDKEAYNVESSN